MCVVLAISKHNKLYLMRKFNIRKSHIIITPMVCGMYNICTHNKSYSNNIYISHKIYNKISWFILKSVDKKYMINSPHRPQNTHNQLLTFPFAKIKFTSLFNYTIVNSSFLLCLLTVIIIHNEWSSLTSSNEYYIHKRFAIYDLLNLHIVSMIVFNIIIIIHLNPHAVFI